MKVEMKQSKQVIVNTDRGTYTFVTAQKGDSVEVPRDVAVRMITDGSAEYVG